MDASLLQTLQTWHSPFLDAWMRALYVATDVVTLSCLALVIGGILWLSGRRLAGAIYCFGVWIGLLWIPLLKRIFGRVRPDLPLAGAPASWSFPSGHAMAAIIFFGLGAILLARGRSNVAKVWIFVAAALIVLLIGFNRVYLGHHWPSDIVGGYFFGGLWLALWSRLLPIEEEFQRHWHEAKTLQTGKLRTVADFFQDHPKLLWTLIILYVVSPIDLIPEGVFGLFGYADDLILLLIPMLLQRRRSPPP